MTPLARRLTPLPFAVTRDLFHPDLPVEEVYRAFEDRWFQEITRGQQMIIYGSGEYVLKVPVLKLALGEEDHKAVYSNPITAGILTFLNSYAEQSDLWRLAKKGMKLALHQFRPQRITDPVEELRGYRIGIEKARDLITPSRIVRADRFSSKRRWLDPDAVGFGEEAILQRRARAFLLEHLRQADQSHDWPLLSGLLTAAFDFQLQLWRRGVVDSDTGINILCNLEVEAGGTLRLTDCGSLTDNLEKARPFVQEAGTWAAEIQGRLEGGERLRRIILAGDPRSTLVRGSLRHTLQRLRKDLSDEGFERAGYDFIRLTAKNLTPENLKRHWPDQSS